MSNEERRQRSARRVMEWHRKNPDRVKAIKRRWNERNRDEINRRAREKNKTPERKAFMRVYAPQHRANNPHLYHGYYQTRRARKASAAGAHTEAQWLAKLTMYHGLCAYCGRREATDRDHDVPLARGGSNEVANIVPACGSCNSAKGTLTGHEYRTRLRGEGDAMDARWKAQLTAAQDNGRRSRWA